MNLDFSPEEIAFRDEVRRFIAAHYPAHLHEKRARKADWEKEDYVTWHRILAKKGWVAPGWPADVGGPGWSLTQKYIFANELARAETIPIPPMGIEMMGPVLYTFGTPEQKVKFLAPTLSSEIWWCQGYSEPGSGSDLASLSTRAVREGDHYVVNGQKTWTTQAHFADWGFFLVRTDTEAKPQSGISFLLIDMKSPGVSVRPIITLGGEHEVNDIYLDNVRVPLENRIFEENQGWTVAKFLLAHERSGNALVAPSKRSVEQLRAMAAVERDGAGGPLLQDPFFKRKIAELEIDLAALEFTELRALADEAAGNATGVTPSMLKIKGTEIQQRVTELALEAAAHHAAPYYRGFPADGDNSRPIGPDHAHQVAPTYFNVRKTTIYSGSNEIQRNIIAKMGLGI